MLFPPASVFDFGFQQIVFAIVGYHYSITVCGTVCLLVGRDRLPIPPKMSHPHRVRMLPHEKGELRAAQTVPQGHTHCKITPERFVGRGRRRPLSGNQFDSISHRSSSHNISMALTYATTRICTSTLIYTERNQGSDIFVKSPVPPVHAKNRLQSKRQYPRPSFCERTVAQ